MCDVVSWQETMIGNNDHNSKCWNVSTRSNRSSEWLRADSIAERLGQWRAARCGVQFANHPTRARWAEFASWITAEQCSAYRGGAMIVQTGHLQR